jgi:6-pyruvoyl-tetrahydropterin synthase
VPQSKLHNMFVRNLTTLDVAVFCPSKGVHGWSWNVDMDLTGHLDQNGFVFDFSHAKAQAKAILKQTFDHKLLIPMLAPGVHSLSFGNEKQLRMSTTSGELWQYSCPESAVVELAIPEVHPSVIEAQIARRIEQVFPNNLVKCKIRLSDENIGSQEAQFCYTHGLPQHDGDCQRLFHGHRSRVEVWLQQERQAHLEKILCEEFFLSSQAHLASESQVIGKSEHAVANSDKEQIQLAYTSSQGAFYASLPSHRVRIVPHETSIECITRSALAYLLESQPNLKAKDLRVLVFEGIDKGSWAEEG